MNGLFAETKFTPHEVGIGGVWEVNLTGTKSYPIRFDGTSADQRSVMKPQGMLGGVIVGAGAALVANLLLFGSLFADGTAEVTLLVLAGLALVVSIAVVALTAIIPSEGPILRAPAARHLTKVA